ncbi:hypothetical protein HY837_05030 [archaeon]|nr:hypothetical protein [archaeon]
MSSEKLLDFERIFATYKAGIPPKQLKKLNSAVWFPVSKNSIFEKELAYLVGKIMGDGHLDKHFTPIFVGQKYDILELKKLISKVFKFEDSVFSIKFRKAKGISYRLSINNSLFGRVLFCLGAPAGDKTKHRGKFN